VGGGGEGEGVCANFFSSHSLKGRRIGFRGGATGCATSVIVEYTKEVGLNSWPKVYFLYMVIGERFPPEFSFRKRLKSQIFVDCH
jgi:hypothetical protein